MGVGPYTITSIRETVIDFSVPFMEDGGGILTKKDNSGSNVMAELGTFSTAVWLSLLGTTLGVGTVFYATLRFSSNSEEEQDKEAQGWRLSTCLLYICGSIMQQGRCLSTCLHSAAG